MLLRVKQTEVSKDYGLFDGYRGNIMVTGGRAAEKREPMSRVRREHYELELLLRNIPSSLMSLFVVSVITMNLLANKSINLPVSWLALDCGIIVSWMSFLSMDIITKHFGPKAATEASAVAVGVNLLACLFFFVASKIPGMWGEAYVDGSEALLNGALNGTFGGTWYVLFGSTTAFIVSAVVNNFLNAAIGRMMTSNPDGFFAYACRTYISTAVGQFTDNLVFALIVSHFFFGWTLLQCVTCAVTGMIVELLCEVLFSRIGFSICARWKRENVGGEYLNYIREKKK